MERRYVVTILVAILVFAVGAATQAAVLGHEQFDYSPPQANLISQNGGVGFSGGWYPTGFNAINQNNYLIGAGSLESGDLVNSANRMTSASLGQIGGIGRDLSVPVQSWQTTTRYMSVLIRPEGTLGQGRWNGFFGLYLDGSQNDMFVGKGGGGVMNRWVLESRGGGNQRASNANVYIDETALLVVKSEFTPGNDTFTLYVNPTPGGPEPVVGTVLNTLNLGTVGKLVVYSTGAFSLDEIRIGETFADVTPIPEPATLLLLAAGAFVVRIRKLCR